MDDNKSYTLGIDIGSTSVKAVVLADDGAVQAAIVAPTGWSSVDAAARIRAVLEERGFDLEPMRCVATGYGRVSVPYANKTVTEITCHARGAAHIHDAPSLTVIDIGGQDTKIIRVENGKPTDFLMNDKCSAGTGRFLEIMGNTMGLRPQELCELARTGEGAPISSLCTVFAESEVVSLIGKGTPREDIAHSIVASIAEKVTSQASRLFKADRPVCLTGGLCDCSYIVETLSDSLRTPVMAVPMGRYAGAVGAALAAQGLPVPH